ncbi:MAG: sigma-70 family RNA polymerase sigma factor [Pedosphaera sp.]|nr:sigma-70 family RNA polymerase sigma factor [Pedosphaera sp.]
MSTPDEAASASIERGLFATTHWSVILAAGRDSSPRSNEALEQLCQTYWYPLYAYVRRSGTEAEDAKDLTQEFFARMLARRFPSGVRPEGGRFRSYLLKSLKHFLTSEWRRSTALKRGGEMIPISFDALDPETRYQVEPITNVTPESLYERRWAAALIEQAMKRLRAEYTADTRTEVFDHLRPLLNGTERGVSYAEIGAKLGLTEAAVKMAVQRLRRRFGECLRLEVAQTVETAAEVDAELRQLLTAVAE